MKVSSVATWHRRATDIVRIAVIAVLCLTAPGSHCRARTLYVDDDAAPGSGDGSVKLPFTLISEGMDASVFGDSVAVLPGVYAESFSVDMHDVTGMNCAAVIMKDGVVLRSTSGVDSTTIEGLGVEAAIYFDGCGSKTTLIGFTIFTDYTGWGLRTSVLCYNSSPLIESNVMVEWLDGIYCRQQSSPVIRSNRVGNGGIVFTSGSGGTVVGNEVESGISVCSSSTPSLPLTIESNTMGVLSGSLHGGRPTSGIFVARGGPGEVTILDNTIQGKDVGARLCRGTLHGNRFTGNTVNIEIGVLAYCSPWEDIDAEANWWGTTDPLEIDAKIIDCYDDDALESCVDFDPWCLDEACTQTAAGEFSWGAIKALYR